MKKQVLSAPAAAIMTAVLLLQISPAAATAAQRGFLINGTAHTVAFKIVVHGVVERLDLPAHHHFTFPNEVQSISGSVTVSGKTCVASTSAQTSSEIIFEYYAKDGRCTFKRFVG